MKSKNILRGSAIVVAIFAFTITLWALPATAADRVYRMKIRSAWVHNPVIGSESLYFQGLEHSYLNSI